MNQEIELYLEKYPLEIVALFTEIRSIILECSLPNIEEKMWAKIPSYYCDKRFIRLILFKDHINVEASGLTKYRDSFEGYKFTPKGMLQIKPGQTLIRNILKEAFEDTLKN